uniref:Uncharacterized protein n=1 Tax=Lactuca sativa TaxID=4236 RepID=A0A9R1XB43_LACSA|nr:hypothetical protein LSAT_V11C500275880 [Lactuca sativa]
MVPVHHFTVARSLNQGYLSGSDHPKKATYMNNSLPFNKMDQLGKSKHSDDPTVNRDVDDSHSTSTSPMNVESKHGEHDQNTHQFEGKHRQSNDDVEEEHLNLYPFVEEELNGSIPNDLTNQTNEFHDVSDHISNIYKRVRCFITSGIGAWISDDGSSLPDFCSSTDVQREGEIEALRIVVCMWNETMVLDWPSLSPYFLPNPEIEPPPPTCLPDARAPPCLFSGKTNHERREKGGIAGAVSSRSKRSDCNAFKSSFLLIPYALVVNAAGWLLFLSYGIEISSAILLPSWKDSYASANSFAVINL